MNKNTVIFLLFLAALFGSTWGSVANRQKTDLEEQLMEARAELQRISRQAALATPAEAPEKSADAGEIEQEKSVPPEKAATVDLPELGMQQKMDEVNAQLIGLEKIVEEKNAALREAAAEKERHQINMDVLLAKIRDLQRELQGVVEENRELVKQLAARNETLGVQK